MMRFSKNCLTNAESQDEIPNRKLCRARRTDVYDVKKHAEKKERKTFFTTLGR